MESSERVPLTADERQTFAWYLAYFAARVPCFERSLNEHETAKRKLFDRAHFHSRKQLQALIDNVPLTDAERADADAELMFEMLKREEYNSCHRPQLPREAPHRGGHRSHAEGARPHRATDSG